MPYPDGSFIVIGEYPETGEATVSLYIEGLYERRLTRPVSQVPDGATKGDVVPVTVTDGGVEEIADTADGELTRAYYDSFFDLL